MAANKKVRFGPVALSATLTNNILNPPTLTGGVVTGTTNTNTYFLIRHIRIINKTANSATFSLWIGATGANAAGTEFEGNGTQVPSNSAYDWYGELRLDVADFLVGGASAGTTLTFQAEGEIGIV
jgi:hypothetical protein